MSCTVAYDSGNVLLIAAVLIAVQVSNGHWEIVEGKAGFAKYVDDIVAPPVFIPGTSIGRDGIAKVAVKWPEETKYALLLLLHEQVPGVSDGRWERAPEIYDMIEAQVRATIATGSALVVTNGTGRFIGVIDAGTAKIVRAVIEELIKLLERLDPAQIERGVILRRAQPQPAGPSPSDAAAALGTANKGQGPGPEQRFKFALASCQYPAGLIDGGIRKHRYLCWK